MHRINTCIQLRSAPSEQNQPNQARISPVMLRLALTSEGVLFMRPYWCSQNRLCEHHCGRVVWDLCRLKQRQSSPASHLYHYEASCSGANSSILLAPTLPTLIRWRKTLSASRFPGRKMQPRWQHGKLAKQDFPGRLSHFVVKCCHVILAFSLELLPWPACIMP